MKTLLGGTDACPSCTSRAEREWKIGKDAAHVIRSTFPRGDSSVTQQDQEDHKQSHLRMVIKIERLMGELDQIEHQIDLAKHNDSIGMIERAETISRLYREAGERRGDIMSAEEEAEEMESGQSGVGK